MSTKKSSSKSKMQTSAKKTKSKTISTKDKLLLVELKKSLCSLTDILRETAEALPSLVSSSGKRTTDNGLLTNRLETDVELIGMLEEFFRNLVVLLRLRTRYDQKLQLIYYNIKKLENAKSLVEFRGVMQLLGIALVEMENIVEDYKEMYTKLFTEQAMLQFQLMEQLLLFRDRNIPGFTKLFEAGLDIFNKINKEMA
ncbi:MAG: hypothetical protein ACTSQK_01660 [Candidatus Heimdallarchaeota archaeon]